MTLDGLFVLGISVLAAAAIPEYAELAAGSALALRYTSQPDSVFALLFMIARILAQNWCGSGVLEDA